MPKISLLYLAVDETRHSIPNLFAANNSPLALLGNIPIARHIQQLKDSNPLIEDVFIACSPRSLIYEQFQVFDDIKLLPVYNTNNPIQTIHQCINYILTEWVHISPITSVINDNLFCSHTAFFEKTKRIPLSWSSLEIRNNEPIYLPKNLLIPNETHAFTGRFTCLSSFARSKTLGLLSSSSSDLIYYMFSEEFSLIDSIIFTHWIDLGHIESIPFVRRFAFSSRHFNSIQLLPNDIIRKSSSDGEKLRTQAEYVDALPPLLKRYFPQTISHGEIANKSNSYYHEMNYIGSSSMSELFLSSKLPFSHTKKVIDKTLSILDEFVYTFGTVEASSPSLNYSLKLSDRISKIELLWNDPVFSKTLKPLYYDDFIVNGRKYQSLQHTYNSLQYFFEEYERNYLKIVSHGDLCFNNIMYDPLSLQLFLIDPKGFSKLTSNNLSPFLDKFYDIAKLDHSITCCYDSITFGFFRLRQNDTTGEYHFYIYSPVNRLKASDYFYSKVSKSQFADFLKIKKYLLSSLFLSMIPLHIDDAQRCIAFAILASSILDSDDYSSLDYFLNAN